ncbi:MAG: FN3 associated domain-containing protein [Bacteroidota bacterium]
MKQMQAIANNSIFALQVLLIFLLIFENQLEIPNLVQVMGRMHPLLLHLPIGFLFLLALLPFLKKQIEHNSYLHLQSFILYISAATAVLVSLAGLLLSQEEGYQSDLVDWHKWTGVGVSFLTYGLLLWHQYFQDRQLAYHMMMYGSVGLVFVAGHLGGSITHGEDFLLEPLQEVEEELVITEEMPVFAALVEPILVSKCVQCHNESKTKGALLMTTKEGLQKGGKHGAMWIAGHADSSLMMQRIYLPLQEKEHMPPKGKAQPTEQEIELLHDWIVAGADMEQRIVDVSDSTDLYASMRPFLKVKTAKEKVKYAFAAADKSVVEELNHPFRSVYPIALNSPALRADIFVRQAYKASFLSELAAIKNQLVALNLSKLPIQDEDLDVISEFSNLEQLILNGTDIEGTALSKLSACKNLKELALSNTKVGAKQLKALQEFPALKEVFVWNLDISKEEQSDLEEKMPNVKWEKGYQNDPDELLQLSPPILKNKSTLFEMGDQAVLENKLPGAVIRYTLDGTEPDSLESPVYEVPFIVESITTIKAKTFRENWLSSPVSEYIIFPKGIVVDSCFLLTLPNEQYKGEGAVSLIDQTKGKAENFRNPAWLGYREEKLEALFDLGEAAPIVKEIVGSFAQNIGSEIFPPTAVEVWGGNTKDNLEKINTVQVEMPTKYERNKIVGVKLPIPNSNYRYYKVIVHPLAQTPKWHALHKKGRRSWAFVDEIFFY